MVDFVSLDTSVTFTTEAEVGDTNCVVIMIIDDADIESNEDFSVSLSAGSNITVLEGRDIQTVSIVDTDRT